MKDEHTNPPKTLPEIGIYMSIHFNNLYKETSEIKALMKEMPSRSEFRSLEKDHDTLKKSHNDFMEKAERTYVTRKEVNAGYVVIAVILAVATSVWTLIDKIRGV